MIIFEMIFEYYYSENILINTTLFNFNVRYTNIFFRDNLIFSSSDMEKFPLRMKDNDLLVTELFKDPQGDSITALSVYLTPRASRFFID